MEEGAPATECQTETRNKSGDKQENTSDHLQEKEIYSIGLLEQIGTRKKNTVMLKKIMEIGNERVSIKHWFSLDNILNNISKDQGDQLTSGQG